MKKFFIVIGAVLFIILAAAIFKDAIIKSAVTAAASQILGAPVEMDSFSLNIFNSTLRISGLKIYNPAGFPKEVFVNLPKINVVADRDDLLKGKLHFVFVEVELQEMVLINDREGKLNADALKVAQQPKSNAPPRPLQIDRLNLGIGRIIHKDYTSGGEPVVTMHELNIHKSYKNITDVRQLALLVLFEPIKSAGIKAAKDYGFAALTGVAALPVFLASEFTGKDSVEESLEVHFQRAYETALAVLKRAGKVDKEDAPKGTISAQVNGARVWLKLEKEAENMTGITISARKYLLPKPDIAGGLLYQITEELQK